MKRAGDTSRLVFGDVNSRTALLAAGVAGAMTGAGVVVNAAGGIVLGIGVCVVGVLAFTRVSLQQVFFFALGFALAGYAVLGRGFAYLGIPPLFIGEMLLGLAVMSVMRAGIQLTVVRSPLSWMLLMFMVWGAVRTAPYVAVHGVDALRDAALWGYGMFALAVTALIRSTAQVESVLRLYGRAVSVLACGMALGLFLQAVVGLDSPRWPWGLGGGVPILSVKSGDVAVHLTGIAAFLILRHRWRVGALKEWFVWGCWIVAATLAASRSRGAQLAILAGLALNVVLGPWATVLRRLVLIGVGSAAVIATLSVMGVESKHSRGISYDALTQAFVSVFRETDVGDLEGTKMWRLKWWGTIVDYTVRGEYFWAGKGFGVNLADDDGFQVLADGSLRSPHNGHLTVLARSGVPGLLLWVVLHISFAVSLVRCELRARRQHDARWKNVNVMILVYWLAFMLNGFFDVFLEGPQGGIWFWTVFGVGLSAIRLQRGDRPRAVCSVSGGSRPPGVRVPALTRWRDPVGCR